MATIKNIAEGTGLSAYTLRYYEKEGMFDVPRNEAGVRQYDATALRRIYALMHYRRAGIPLAQIKEIFNTPNDDEFHLEILRERKESLAREIAEMQETMGYLDYKIALHEGTRTTNLTMEDWLKAWDEDPQATAAMALKKVDGIG